MEIGLGVLQLSPAVFWDQYTLPELFAAIDGYVESQGGNEEEEREGLSNEDREDLLDMIEERHAKIEDQPFSDARGEVPSH